MKKKMLVLAAVLALLAAATMPAFASDEEGVSCTVSVKNISLGLSTSSVDYGSLPLSTADTPSSGTSAEIWATNDGTVTENFNIKGANATGDTTPWTLSGSRGADQYVHEFGKPAYASWTALTTSYQVLETGIAVDGSQAFKLKITMPNSSTDIGTKSTSVWVQATE